MPIRFVEKPPTRFEFWSETWRWPRDTNRYTFLAKAVDELGQAMFGTEWTGAESSCPDPTYDDYLGQLKDLAMKRISSTELSDKDEEEATRILDQYVLCEQSEASTALKQHIKSLLEEHAITDHEFEDDNSYRFGEDAWREGLRIARDQDAARRRFERVKLKLATGFAEGQLVSVLRGKKGGAYSQPVASENWILDDYTARFFNCMMNPDDPLSPAVAGDGFQYIFVERKSLEQMLNECEIKDQPSMPEDVPEGMYLSPYMRLMIDAVRALGITEVDQPRIVRIIQPYIDQQWREKRLPESRKLRTAMATMLREPKNQGGKNKNYSGTG